MQRNLHHFLRAIAVAFCEGRLDHVAQHFSVPMPLYTDKNLIVFGARHSLVEALDLYLQAVRKAGIVRIEPRIVATGIPVKGYSNLWVEWDHFDENDTCVKTSQVRYAIHHERDALTPQLEMVDYTISAFPDVMNELPLQRSA